MANDSLKADGCSLRIYDLQGRLYLRGQLPHPRTGVMSRQWYTLGLPSVPSRLREAKIKALSLSEDLRFGRFRWPEDRLTKEESVERVKGIQLVENAFFERKKGKSSTWHQIYRAHYDQLRNHDYITMEILYRYCESKPADRRSRQTAITAIKFFAEVMNWPFSMERVRGADRLRPVKERDLPSDSEIEAMWEATVDNKPWQLAIGLMATFGLRNHEVFTCDYARFCASDEPFLLIKDGKTGQRRAYAFHHHWIDQFKLREGILPKVSGRDHVRIGGRVTQFFLRREYCSPYNLRHAYAVRMLVEQVPMEIAAAYMGHSVRVHTQVYQKWINELHLDVVYQRYIDRR
ncbi:hypothetical protein VZG28_04715 [Synechococcus elongatus IITB4]|uniref:hypothetical protein n=1 Tax=Synechococcus elongatus TaxID=32046 RepID=UPI0030CDFE3B